MKNFEIKNNYYNWDTNGKPRYEAPNGVYHLTTAMC